MATDTRNALTDVKRELLAKLLEAEGINVEASIPRRGLTRAPLSFAQQRMWFLDQMEPGTAVFNLCFGVRLKGNLDIDALRATLNAVVARHDVMRTSFELDEDAPVQVVHPGLTLDVPLDDLSGLSPDERHAEYLRVINEEQQKPFDISRAPLIRVRLMSLAADEHVLVTTVHHIISDGWSSGVLLREFVAGYAAFHEGRPLSLPDLPIQYSDYAAWQREWLSGPELKRQIDYWKRQLAGTPAGLDVPTDFPRPAVQTMHGKRQLFMLPSSLSAAVHSTATRLGVTPFMVLMGTFHLLMARYSGQRDILIGTPVAGRGRVETEPLIGVFVNPLVMRCHLDGNPSVREFLAHVREVTLDGFAHADLPFEKLVEELQPARDLSRTPLFQAMFILLNAPGGELVLPDLAVSEVASEKLYSEYDLTITLREHDGRTGGSLEYNSDLFSPSTAQRILDHYQKLLEGVCGTPEKGVFELPMLSAEERRRAIFQWNDTQQPQPADNVPGSFEQQALRTPNRTAVACADAELTYKELNFRANQLARRLREEGVGPDVLVGVCVRRSLDMVVALLAVLKAGGAYVPLDPEYPSHRIEYMLSDSGAPLLLTHESLLERLPASNAKVMCLDRDWPLIAANSGDNFENPASADNLAYVIYTSGSTGNPKGVMIPHVALSNFLQSMSREPGLGEQDTLLAITTLSFDIAGLEMYLPLLQGGRIEIATREECIDGARLAEKIQRLGITVMQATPATWRLLLETGWQGKKDLKVLVGGEAVPHELAAKLLERVGEVWNVYGPTETTVWSTTTQITAQDSLVSIGRPIANTTVYILDSQLEPVPVGVVGEIFIGGIGLARGYLNRPELTSEKFIDDPLRPGSGMRIYRTGDLGRYLPDGRIECLGRVDHQVKIRGYRIELGEIEAALATYPGVQQNVVVVRDDQFGEKVLVAFLVGDKQRLLTDEISTYLRGRLPSFMVPAVYVFLDALPLTPNGKIDRGSLPKTESARPQPRVGYVAPRNELEKEIAAVWASVLKLEQVGVNENFFELGGHSLLLARVHMEVRRRTQCEVSIVDLFRYPTVSALAEFLGSKQVQPASVALSPAQQRAQLRRKLPARQGRVSRGNGSQQAALPGIEVSAGPSEAPATEPAPLAATPVQVPATTQPAADAEVEKRKLFDLSLHEEGTAPTPIRRRLSNDPVPLSLTQQRMWFLDQLDPGNSAYKVQGVLPVRGDLDVEILRRSVAEVAARHESLRTVFTMIDGTPMQVVGPVPDLDIPLADVSHLAEAEQKAETNRIIDEDLAAPFNLKTGPLFALKLIRVARDRHVLVISMHHIASDGWSLRIFVREIAAFYEAAINAKPCPLPDLPVQYADFSQWQRKELQSDKLQSQLQYWRRKLAGPLPILELPTDFARSSQTTSKGAVEHLLLPTELADKLQQLSRRERVSLFMTMLAVFELLMCRLADQQDVCVGTPVAGRNRIETENLIGFFVGTLVWRTDLSGDPTFIELLRRVRETVLDAQSRQDIPFEMLVEDLQPERGAGRTPLFQVFFNMVNLPPVEPPGNHGGLTFDAFIPLESQAKFDLTLYVTEEQARTRLSILYPTGLFRAERVQEMLAQYCLLLEQVVKAPAAPVSAYSLVTAVAERILPSPRANLRSSQAPRLQQRLSEVALSSQSRTAVSDPDESWTYAQLESWSNRLAAHLNANGVGKGDTVAIYSRRSATLVWALLGVMKSGAAFVIFDSATPSAYQADMARVASPRVLIQVGSAGELPGELAAALGETVPLIRLPLRADAERGEMFAGIPDTLPQNEIGPDDVAYIAFTSGTTSRPKGIVGTFGPLSHFLDWHARKFRFDHSDRFSMLSGLAHDPLLRDILAPLWVGASLQIIHPEDRVMPVRLLKWAQSERISVMHLTPQMLGILSQGARETGAHLPQLRYVFLGGDVLQTAEVEQLMRFAPEARVVNFYGTTETPQGVAFHEHLPTSVHTGTVPLGRGIDGVQLLVLNRAGQLAGIGESGEIHVRTPHLAKGYCDHTLTRERFIPNPATGDSEDRMYKTGDLGRYLLSGEVEFRGRGDQQIKLRGNRVEIPLVESVLRGHPQVDRCVVAARSTSDGELRLIAYVVAREGAKPSPQELRTYMQSRLASYMVPAAFIAIPEIPLNANCKVDLAALPDFEIALQERTEFTPPEGEMEAELARVWQRVLGVARVGRHDDFFDLGGHSLLANRLLTEIEKSFGHTLPVATLFEAPTVARLAEIMKNDGWTAPYSSLVRIKDEGSAPAFVCVHSLGANLVSYAGLAKRLGDNQPFYGLQPQGLDGKEQPHTRVEDMAERYIRELKKAQPDGPYYLGGVCLGGVVAFEMAQRLVAEGDEIGALVLIDTFCPGTPKHLPAHPDPFGLVQHVDWYAGEVLMRSWSERIPYLGTRAANVGRRAYALARTIVSKAIPSLAEQRGTTEAILQHVKSVNSQAWGQYKPKPYPGKITLLWCSETPTRCYRDRRLAWSDVAEHGLEVHIIPGNHMTMVEPPHVDVMAEILGRCLQRAHQEHEQSRTMAVDL